MSTAERIVALECKPDFAEAARRWAAYLAGDVWKRPPVLITVQKEGASPPPMPTYRDRVFGDFDEVIDQALANARATHYFGEAMPAFGVSFGVDELAVFCGGGPLLWNKASGDTNWTEPFVDDWEKALPLRLHEESPLWQRLLAFYRRAAERLSGKMVFQHFDIHSNLGLLAAVRGAERLCLDLIDCPATIDRAMESARALYPRVWRAMVEAGRFDRNGYHAHFYSPDGAAILQCDFSIMISPDLFRRWVLPALEEEARLVRHAYYHWDGVGAMKHEKAILSCRGIHTIGFLPGEGHGPQSDYLDLFCRCQAAGKGVHVGGTFEQVKVMHRKLDPALTIYSTAAPSPREAEEILRWFENNT